MRWMLGLVLMGAMAAALALADGREQPDAGQQPQQAAADPAVVFRPLDVLIDTKARPLAAYQFELVAEEGDVAIVGVEGAEHAAFAEPPFYDPAALSQGRIIIAAYSTGADLPAGRVRIARVHVRITGAEPARYQFKGVVAASREGESIAAEVSIMEGETR